LKAHR
jgi:hypothetical protein